MSAETVAWQAVLLEFRAHTARHPNTLARYAELHEIAIAGGIEILGGLFERAGTAPPLPLRTLSVAFLAVGTGLAAELLIDPELDVRAIAGHMAEGIVARAVEHS